MKYIVNEQNSCGQASLSDEKRNTILEALGYEVKPEEQLQESVSAEVEQEAHTEEEEGAPALYEWDDAVFALEEEVFEIEGNLFLRAFELDGETKMALDESHADLFISDVSFDSDDYSLGDIYDYGDDIFIKLDEKRGFKKGTKSKNKPEDEGDFETGMRQGDKSNQQDDEGDKPDFTTDMRKGDQSKTHPGRKDFVKKKRN